MDIINTENSKAWVLAISMGYGHQRTADNIRFLSPGGEVINANDYDGIPTKDKRIWVASRESYEFVSRLQSIPIFGEFIFFLYDRFQRILDFYPKRDLSKPNIQLKQMYAMIKKGWGKHLIEKLIEGNKKIGQNIPIVSTFFTMAFMAEIFEYPGDIFCVTCDSDISRTWAPLNPKESRIKYIASTPRAAERLRLYGIKPENIFSTGYPLPLENIGSENMEILKTDMKDRILVLDPDKKYFQNYKSLIEGNLGQLPEKPGHILTIMFAVGGAGAQKEISYKFLKNLKNYIKDRKIKIILVAGTKGKVNDYFLRCLKTLKIDDTIGEGVEIIFEKEKDNYFRKFNERLRKTDILWTKPSEISFYASLGVPIIIAPPLGSQEDFNKRWLLKSGFGFSQENPRYTDQWLFEWLQKGYFAEAAMQGFIEGEKFGALNIKKIIF